MKIAVIGGGSSYSPELIDGLFPRLKNIPVSEVWMMDPNTERLNITAGLARRMAEHHGNPFSIHQTADMREAVQDAKYVITQLRVGGIQARINDEKLGLKYNIIGQETTGVGGFACALRTIRPILEIAHAMEELSPDGTLINFTNPSGIVTEAVLKHSKIRAVGLCNVPIGIIMEIVDKLHYRMEDIELDYIGLNHLSWVRSFKANGKDITAEAMDMFFAHAEEEFEEETIRKPVVAAMKSLNMFVNYYLQYYYATEEVLAHLKQKKQTRGEEIIDIEKTLFEKYAQKELTEKPEELSKRGGAHYSTAAFHLIEAIENDRRNRQIVCCRNNGAVPTFDDDVSVEVSAIISANGAEAIPQKAPEPSIRGLMQIIKAYESLTVQAAVSGDKEAAFQAMLLHPLMPGATRAAQLLDELIEINKQHLNGMFS